eukprot:2808838-Rhodomonas_salina.2
MPLYCTNSVRYWQQRRDCTAYSQCGTDVVYGATSFIYLGMMGRGVSVLYNEVPTCCPLCCYARTIWLCYYARTIRLGSARRSCYAVSHTGIREEMQLGTDTLCGVVLRCGDDTAETRAWLCSGY